MTFGTVLAIGLGTAACGPRPETTPLPMFKLGVTDPLPLFRYEDRPGAPPECHRGQILDRIKVVVEEVGCRERDLSAGESPMRLITCDLPADPSARTSRCPAKYLALVWQEGWTRDGGNYDLQLYARVRAECGTNKEYSTFVVSKTQRKAMEPVNRKLSELFRSCTQRPDAGH